jgi:uncharacterized protein (DUF1501 family)
MTISRRHFLTGIGASGAAVALGCSGGEGASSPASSTTSSSPVRDPGTLVVVTLFGGNDALGTVVPVEDPIYREARGALALDPAGCHPIGEGFALHPALAETGRLWEAGRLAVVHGVGFEGLDRSHPHCADVWQAGEVHDLDTGWLGRWLDLGGDDPLQALAVGDALPLALRGERRAGSVVPVGPVALPGGESLRGGLSALAAADEGRSPLADLAAGSLGDLLAVVDAVHVPLAGAADSGDVQQAAGLGAQLDVVARLIEAGLPTRAYATALDGFDTHAGQAPTHERLLAELDAALAAFLGRMDDRPVTVVVHSEFGRRVRANASGGTDHGAAGTVLLAGRVRSGHHGDPPPLATLVDGDLATTVDFRSVWGGLLEGVLGVEAGDVLPGAPAPLSLV